MHKSVLVVSLIGLLMLPGAVSAWNMSGHQTVAAVAYLSLSPGGRSQVDALLRQHPDFASLSEGLSPSDPELGLIVFMRAAQWPDVIRDDPRFFDDTNASATPTPLLAGFPDMMIHKPWHFIDQGFSTDGTPTRSGTGPGALTKIVELQRSLGDPAVPDSVKAYNISWLLHLVGDIHQPLHSLSRFSSRHTSGDRGGNSFKLSGRDSNLHSFWDNSLTRDQDSTRLVNLARDLMREIQPDTAEVAMVTDPEVATRLWACESTALTKYVAYTVGEEESTPISVSRSYRRLATKIARHRAVIAGYRLAELLNQRLAAPGPSPT